MTSTATSQPVSTSLLDPTKFPQSISATNIHISLTYNTLDTSSVLSSIRSPTSGANVLFLGTTRDNFSGRPVSRLSYQAYPALALKSFHAIAEEALRKFVGTETEQGLEKVAITHRLGEVSVCQESIAVAVSAGHRKKAWEGAEWVLERCKESVEVWKLEVFADETEGSQWRANSERNTDGKLVKSGKDGVGS